MHKIVAVRTLNGTEGYRAIVGKDYTCPDGTTRLVRSITQSENRQWIAVICTDDTEVWLPMDKVMIQWGSSK